MSTTKLTIRQTYLRWIEDQCPAGAWALAVEGRPGPRGMPALRGTAIHAIAAEYTKALVASRRSTDWDALAAITADVLKASDNLTVEARQEVERQAANLREITWDIGNLFGIEEPLEATLWLTDEVAVTITGTADLLMVYGEGLAEVVDYKSNFALPSDSATLEDFQLKTYAWLVWAMNPGLEAVAGRIFNTRFGVYVPQHEPAVWTADELEAFGDHLTDMLRAFYLGRLRHEFHAGQWCQWCPRAKPTDCPRWRAYDKTAPPPLRTFYQARAAANRLEALEQERGRLVDRLKSYVALNGPVELGRGAGRQTLDFHATESVKHKATTVLAVLKDPTVEAEVGKPDLDKILSVDNRSATWKRLQRAATVRDLLAEYEPVRKVSTRFGRANCE